MAKRATPTPQQTEPTFLIKSKSIFKTEIEDRISKGEEILKSTIQTETDFINIKKGYSLWTDYNLELLKQSFNKPINEYRKSYDDAGEWSGLFVSTMDSRTSVGEQVQKFTSKFSTKIDNLKKLLQKIDLLKSSEPEIEQKENLKAEFDMTQVFIVHGHDELAKSETARFVSKLGFEPIILHEQASSGKTIIEKIEEYTNVGFGIVLYTPCDLGARKGDEEHLKSRARQNVVFEHGYLIGKIGRENVCALVKGNIETPNDISGVVYVSMDGNWKLDLAKELRNSGYKVDMNLVI
ncbi:putative nucleotide-binding protein [Flavobacterium sp. CG_9.10]|uniref:TIR domain-containing protein n=1 Tax=Flavobacterium sp. CG_9.10 TaxID=2787729 RepID=UPI001A1A115E|nr:nucleotide-binding protein [Flavobacterium sp. CG_9.10]MBG6111045.1 putative nucleotide-binding protein [Flavobacterium sp. CG_9.10]